MSEHEHDRYVVVSADCHAGAPLLGYREYLDARYRDDFDRWAAEFVNPFEDLDEVYADRNWDSAKRLAHLEGDGIAAEVIFPNTVPPFFPRNGIVAGAPSAADYEQRWAGLQAHNRWLVDFCNEVPGRRAGIAQLLFNDPDDAVAEIARTKEAGLFGGVLLPSIPPGSSIPPIWSADYDRIWAACVDLDVPVNHHGGSGSPDYGWELGHAPDGVPHRVHVLLQPQRVAHDLGRCVRTPSRVALRHHRAGVHQRARRLARRRSTSTT